MAKKEKNTGLGRGLDSLIPKIEETEVEEGISLEDLLRESEDESKTFEELVEEVEEEFEGEDELQVLEKSADEEEEEKPKDTSEYTNVFFNDDEKVEENDEEEEEEISSEKSVKKGLTSGEWCGIIIGRPQERERENGPWKLNNDDNKDPKILREI